MRFIFCSIFIGMFSYSMNAMLIAKKKKNLSTYTNESKSDSFSKKRDNKKCTVYSRIHRNNHKFSDFISFITRANPPQV